jgi:hypothetical protein
MESLRSPIQRAYTHGHSAPALMVGPSPCVGRAGAVPHQLPEHVAADGTQLVAGVGQLVVVYDASDGDVLHTLKGHKVTVVLTDIGSRKLTYSHTHRHISVSDAAGWARIGPGCTARAWLHVPRW